MHFCSLHVLLLNETIISLMYVLTLAQVFDKKPDQKTPCTPRPSSLHKMVVFHIPFLCSIHFVPSTIILWSMKWKIRSIHYSTYILRLWLFIIRKKNCTSVNRIILLKTCLLTIFPPNCLDLCIS